MKKLLCVFFLFQAILLLKGQDQYDIQYETESGIILSSAIMLGSSYLIDKDQGVLKAFEINRFRIENINVFDRSATKHNSANADLLSDVFLTLNSFAPLALVLTKRGFQQKEKIALLYGEAFLLNGAITLITKSMSQRPRPYVYNAEVSINEKLKLKSKKSFFSGHVSQSSALAFFGASVFVDLYPESKYKALVWTGAVTLPIVTAYGRYKAGKHFPTDLIAGYVIGASVGILVPKLHRVIDHNDKKIHLSNSNNGIGIKIDIDG